MTSSLKPVPSFHKKLVLDKLPSSFGKTCSISQAKLPEFPVNVIRKSGALVTAEPQKAVPFVES
ncbi:peroxiredoxin [Rhizobium giardinii]|uniref:Peroxiredoxin n=1 Tax=Rhizobium giardinii TaxID=56731 RepID=A0A7W8XBR5_9HYPH|nr:peroxiredoxin [Rhizobium giardinii]